MSLIIADRVKETSSSVGAGDLTLDGAITGFQTFAAKCAIGDTFYYALQAVDGGGAPTGEWECGLGTYSAANVLTRTTVTASSTGSILSLAAGSNQVFIAMPAEQVAWLREKLSSERTYYVSTTGSDSADGLTVGTPFLTIQKAVKVVCNQLDTQDYGVTIQLADGTYTAGAGFTSKVGSGAVTIKGNTTTPSNVLVSCVSANCFWATSNSNSVWTVKDLKVQTTTAGSGLLATEASAVIQFSNIEFGVCVTAHTYADNYGRIQCVGNYKIVGGAQFHHQVSGCGVINVTAKTVTITGTPYFSVAYAWADSLGAMVLYANTYSGAATGQRYALTRLSIIHVNGAAITYLPGNTAGVVSTGSVYS